MAVDSNLTINPSEIVSLHKLQAGEILIQPLSQNTDQQKKDQLCMSQCSPPLPGAHRPEVMDPGKTWRHS